MPTRIPFVLLVACAFALPAVVVAHSGGEATLIVPVDHVLPGEDIPVIGADLGSDATLKLELVQASRTAELGTVTAGADGHFSTNLPLPDDFPNGYAELVASGDDGSRASTWILVGPRTQTTPASPDDTQWWQDPSIWLLSALLGGGGIALALMALRSRKQQQAVVPRVRRKARRR
jgi:hypothetical protein